MLSTILLIDDDPTTNFVNERLLRRLNVCHEVLVAPSGAAALDLLAKHCGEEPQVCPDLVLLDIKMPVMDGFEFLEAFIQLPPCPDHSVVVVLLTSSQLDRDLSRIKQLPVTDFLTKPLTTEKVTRLLGQYFDPLLLS
jgi:CheY-like chemotaxis protein